MKFKSRCQVSSELLLSKRGTAAGWCSHRQIILHLEDSFMPDSIHFPEVSNSKTLNHYTLQGCFSVADLKTNNMRFSLYELIKHLINILIKGKEAVFAVYS